MAGSQHPQSQAVAPAAEECVIDEARETAAESGLIHPSITMQNGF